MWDKFIFMKRFFPNLEIFIFAFFIFLPFASSADSDVKKVIRRYDIPLDSNYISLPLAVGAPEFPLQIVEICDGKEKTLHKESVSLSPANPDWTASLDIKRFKGKKLALKIELPQDKIFVPEFTEKPAIESSASYLKEPNRPLFHLTAPFGWLHDPNGLVFWEGKWRAFHQYSPCATAKWKSPMHWKLAESEDLVNWEYKPIAIYPIMNGENMAQAFSGTAYADSSNQSGLFSSGKGGVILAYTRTGIGESLAYTEDFKTFKDFGANPVIRSKGRDPHIFFHKPTRKWIIFRYEALGDDKPNNPQNRAFSIWTSDNLREWNMASVVKGSRYECPDIFEIRADDGKCKWVLLEANGEYSVGDFDGRHFNFDGEINSNFLQGTNYAGQTFDNAPDSRVVMMAIMRAGDLPRSIKMPFMQELSIPMEISLKRGGDGKYKLSASPAKEILNAFGNPQSLLGKNEIGTSSMSEIEVSLEAPDSEFEVDIAGAKLSYCASDSKLSIRENFGKKKLRTFKVSRPAGGAAKMRIFIDKISIEIYWNGGENVIFGRGNFPGDKAKLEISAKNANFKRLDSSDFIRKRK